MTFSFGTLKKNLRSDENLKTRLHFNLSVDYPKLRGGSGSCIEQIYKTRAVFGYVCASFCSIYTSSLILCVESNIAS